MKQKTRFDNIVKAFKADKLKYVKTKQGKEKCRMLFAESKDRVVTTFMTINLDNKEYYIATTLSTWFVEYLIYAIKD